MQVNFEAVHNIDEWGADFVPSMREALRCWNMTVRFFLTFVTVVLEQLATKTESHLAGSALAGACGL